MTDSEPVEPASGRWREERLRIGRLGRGGGAVGRCARSNHLDDDADPDEEAH